MSKTPKSQRLPKNRHRLRKPSPPPASMPIPADLFAALGGGLVGALIGRLLWKNDDPRAAEKTATLAAILQGPLGSVLSQQTALNAGVGVQLGSDPVAETLKVEPEDDLIASAKEKLGHCSMPGCFDKAIKGGKCLTCITDAARDDAFTGRTR